MTSTRDRLISATNELFRRRGYNGTSLKQVTDVAAAPTGSLYHFFPGGKAELAETVIVETGAAYLELFELISAAATDPVAAITDFFDGAAETLEENGFIDVCPIGTVAREVANTDDRLRRAADRVFSSWIEAVERHLEEAGMGPDAATSLAATLVAGLEGGFVLARTRRDGDLLRDTGRHLGFLVALHLSEAHPTEANLTEAPGRTRIP